jgi:hypothetical protein
VLELNCLGDDFMKNKKQVYIVLGIILGVLLCSSIYVNLIAKTTTGLMAVIIAQMIIGIGAAIFTLFTGLKLFEDKKNYELMLIALLELAFTGFLVTLNTTLGYASVVNYNDYIDFMSYVSLQYDIIIYFIFTIIIGVLTLNLFIKERFSVKNIKEEIVQKEA